MNKVLIDSNIWIEYLKQGKKAIADEVDLLLDEDRVALCGMVELEILQGVKSKERNFIKDLFDALHFIESERDDFIQAGLTLNQLRTKGFTLTPSDCLIGIQCIRKEIPIFTLDKDFNHIPHLKKYHFKN